MSVTDLQLVVTKMNSQPIAALFCQAVLMNTGILKIRCCVCHPMIDKVVDESIFLLSSNIFTFTKIHIILSKLTDSCS